MHDALGDALVIEVGDLLAEDEVFEQRRTARRGAQRILVVREGHALVGRERGVRTACQLLQLIAGSRSPL